MPGEIQVEPGALKHKRVFASDEEYAALKPVALSAVAAHTGKPESHLRVTGHNAFRTLLHVEDVIESHLYIYSVDTGNIFD